MFFIICHHFIVTRNGYALNQIASNNYSGPKLFILLNCFFVIAVNVFFISSGYCGINYKRRNLVTMVVNTYIVSIIISLIFILNCSNGICLWVAKSLVPNNTTR